MQQKTHHITFDLLTVLDLKQPRKLALQQTFNEDEISLRNLREIQCNLNKIGRNFAITFKIYATI